MTALPCDIAGLDRARGSIDLLHAGVAAGLSQIERNQAEIRRLARENVDLEALVAANQQAAAMLEASLVATGFVPAPASGELEIPREASLFVKMSAVARGLTLRFQPARAA